jgi:hypothetical protein
MSPILPTNGLAGNMRAVIRGRIIILDTLDTHASAEAWQGGSTLAQAQ